MNKISNESHKLKEHVNRIFIKLKISERIGTEQYEIIEKLRI